MERKKTDIIIFGGQSNMQGQTESLPESNDPVEGALEFRYYEDALIPLQNPVGEAMHGGIACMASSQGHGSLVPAFCRAYHKESGKHVVAIHAARGATVLGEWLPGTQLWYHLKRKTLAGLSKVRELYDVENVYYVWLQGESDALIGTEEDEYLDRLIAYKNHLKETFGIDKFAIIKVGYFIKHDQCELIMNAQERAVESDCDFVMLSRICPELSLKQEYINPHAQGHYNNAAMEIIGTDAGTALAKLSD